MSKSRMEAFSDGVIAIIITIMVLELKAPESLSLEGLGAALPNLAAYVLSFAYVGIYWVNHHHLLQAAECVNGRILWANLHLLFWLSLIPFATVWMGARGWQGMASVPVAAYGVVLGLAGFAYFLLTAALVRQHGAGSPLALAVGRDWKSLLSIVSYGIAIGVAFFCPWVSACLYVAVALMWLVPDRRIERQLGVTECPPDT